VTSLASLTVAVLFVPAQLASGTIVNGVLFAALAGAAIFAICRSSNRN
jgi:hypothetical protein